MNYPEINKLMVKLVDKENKTSEEERLLAELQSLSSIIKKSVFSLSLSNKVCKSCGRPL